MGMKLVHCDCNAPAKFLARMGIYVSSPSTHFIDAPIPDLENLLLQDSLAEP